MAVDVVWFKKDLRIRDHRPLFQACQSGAVICLYIYEPIIFAHREFDTSRLDFTNQCLRDLDQSLKERGGHLTCRVGSAVQVLQRIHDQVGIARLWSHEETGSGRTYERDMAVGQWAQAKKIEWTEIPQTGVVRRLKSRDGWARTWNQRMSESLTDPVEAIITCDAVAPGSVQTHHDLGLAASGKEEALPGGESQAIEMLDSFLDHRGVNYRKDMSNPVTAWDGCSRLSPYLAAGAISMRTVTGLRLYHR